MDPDLVPTRMTTIAALTAQETRGARFAALILGLFAGSALLLAALGTFGLVSYSAAQRTREIGIRISFGATPGDIRRLVIGTGLRPILIGVAAGAAGSIAAGRILSSLLADAARPDAGSFAAAAALLLVTAVVATLIPARRATTIDPIVALGSE
jgi:ABC-type antimicrobial peptide transport system permease subunit